MNRRRLVDNRALRSAVLVGSLLQLIAVLVAHFSVWLELHALLFGTMMISATIGYLYAQDVAWGYAKGACGGALAGGLCALLGVAVSGALGDLAPIMLPIRAA